MSDGEGTGSVAAALWSPLAPGGVHQPRWFQIDLPPSVLVAWSESTDIEPQRHINKLRPSILQFVFAPGPSSSAVRSGYTSSTTMVLWPALSLVTRRTALLLTTPGRRFLP